MLMAATCAQANPIYSHDFEDSTSGDWAPDFTQILDSAAYADPSLLPIIGNHFAVIYANQMTTLTMFTDTFAVGHTYDFSLDHFTRSDQTRAGGEAIKLEMGYDHGGKFRAIASQEFANTGSNPTTLIRRSIRWTATAGGAELGERIVLRVSDAGLDGHAAANQAAIDNISLTAFLELGPNSSSYRSIPEPESYALILGLLGLSSVMRRRRLLGRWRLEPLIQSHDTNESHGERACG